MSSGVLIPGDAAQTYALAHEAEMVDGYPVVHACLEFGNVVRTRLIELVVSGQHAQVLSD